MNKFQITIWIVLFASILLSFSCKKSGTNCMTSAGKVISENRSSEDFDSILLIGYVNLYLTQDSINSVTVESGQNIIDGIITEVNNHLLTIKNINECNWLRSYNVPINVRVSLRNLQKLTYESSGNVYSTNQIVSNNLTIVSWGGCGTIDLSINVEEGFFILQQGTVNYKLRGHCSISSVYAGDFGPFDCRDLTTGYTFVTNRGSNDCYINVSQYLDATINSIGNIYYRGTPDSIITHINGSGKVIPY